MIKYTLTFLLLGFYTFGFTQGVVISPNEQAIPDPSAMLDVQSTEKGFLPPRMTTSDRTNILNPANGLVVYDTNVESLFLFNGTEWMPLMVGTGSLWEANGDNIFRNTGNVGIGINTPQVPLHLRGGVGVSWQVDRVGGSLLRGTANLTDASVGTQNPTAFRLLTNNTVRMHIASNGNIGIGTVTPGTRLHLVGDLRIQDGSQGAGKVLTSDAVGNATWSKLDLYGSNTVVVDASGGGNFLTITSALNSVSPTAENPVTILIKPGTYFETVVLKSHVRLVGEDENNVLITGWADAMPGLNGYVYGMLLNTVTDVQIRNLTIRSNSTTDPYLEFGVWMIGSEARFENVHIKGDFASFLMLYRGIKAKNSTVEFINGSILDTDTRSIELLNSEARVINSKLSSSTIHIEVENGSNLNLTSSQLTGGGDGVSISSGGFANLVGNRFENNWNAARNNGRLLMSANHIRSTASAGVLNNSHATITGNYFIDCVASAILDFSPAGRTTITGNRIENSSHQGQPAFIVNSDAVISSNTFYNNTHGDISAGNNKPWLIGNNGSVSGNPISGIMAGIGDMRVEREGNDLLINLPGDGKVGIGTLNPRGRLNVSLNSGVTNESTIDEYPVMISYPSNATGQETGIAFRISVQQNPTQTPGAAITHLRTGTGLVGDLLFKTKESGDSGPLAERMRITSTGYVGIGTQSPLYKLSIIDSETQRGVFVDQTAIAGTRYGLWARSAAISGTGIRGSALHASGATFGLYGEAESTSGTGVYATANAATGTTYGLQSYSASTSGRAVYGYATALSGTNYGVFGRTNSADGYAGYFLGGRNYFEGKVGIGVSNPDYPLHIESESPLAAIYVKSTSAIGTTWGIHVESVSSQGRAVYGFATASSGINIGVYGRTNSTSGRAVYGYASQTTGTTFGVYGESNSVNGTAVYGKATQISGSNYGVLGESSSTSGHGVYGRGAASSGVTYGVRGEVNSADGFAAYFSGADGSRNYFQRRVGIGTTNPGFLLHVNGDAGKPGGGTWSVASDARLKTNVQDLHSSLENLLKLRGVTFLYNDPEAIHELPGERIGMIAQEVAEVFPDWISEGNDGYLRLTYRGFEALIVEALRELRAEKDAEIESLKTRLEALEASLDFAGQPGSRVSLD